MAAIGRGPVAVDTSPFIYFIEEHPDYLPVVEPVFAAIDAGRLDAVTSSQTLLEVLVVPYRAGDRALAERYEALLTRSRGLCLIEIDRSILRATALLRATTRVRTPDGIQLASALGSGCTAFLTNDRDLPPVPGLDIVQMSNFVGLG